MHDIYMNPMALKIEHQYPLHQGHDFGSEHITSMAGDSHSPHDSPSHDYTTAFDFPSPAYAHSESMYSSAPYQTAYSAPQPLHPLNTTTLWPSQLTNPSGSSPQMLPLQPRTLAPVTQDTPAPPVTAPTPPPSKPIPTLPTSRKTLTDNDRRRMCKYHEDNPTVKQTEIGAIFGVERSTVSKVLRNKEKYLVAEAGRRSPVKKSKSKFPDIERTLTNWAKNRLSEGLPIDDDLIRDEARKFASTLGSAECHSQVNDPVWLEKFKQKNQLPGAKPSGEKTKSNSLSPKSGSQTPNGTSPAVGWDGLPTTQLKEESKTKSPDSIFDNPNPWGHAHSQSTASLGSCFSDASFSTEFRTPTSPYFSPMSSCGPSPAMPTQKAPRLPTLAPAKFQRRQTVPLVSRDDSSDSTKPKHGVQQLASASAMDANREEMDISPIGVDTSVSHTRQSTSATNSSSTATTSPFSMAPPSTSISPSVGSITSLSNTSSPSSPPSQDEARAALETLRKFIEHQPNGAIDPHDYLVMGKWMQMLKLEGGVLPGGMHTIPMAERADGTLPIGRKRSEHSLS
ncbi:MAG: hypothetical protein Q9217_006461 [Psora testacea]